MKLSTLNKCHPLRFRLCGGGNVLYNRHSNSRLKCTYAHQLIFIFIHKRSNSGRLFCMSVPKIGKRKRGDGDDESKVWTPPKRSFHGVQTLVSFVSVGIIGNAKSTRMTAEVFKAACAAVLVKLPQPNHQIHLVSGGSSWMDHVAVRLFIDAAKTSTPFHGLTLHLPCSIVLPPILIKLLYDKNSNKDKKGKKKEEEEVAKQTKPDVLLATFAKSIQFVDLAGSTDFRTNPGWLLNKYHRQFAAKLGIPSTILEIVEATQHGAQLIMTKGFLPRNVKVAKQSELLIALTWGQGTKEPSGRGTLYTWRRANRKSQTRVHIPLCSLSIPKCLPESKTA